MDNQKITEKIIISFRVKIILNIIKEYKKEIQIIEIFICDIDRFEELKEYENILNELVNKQAIKKFQIIQKPKRDIFKIEELTPPTPLQVENDPTIIYDYQKDQRKQFEDEGCYQLDAPCNILKINKQDINLKKIKKLLPQDKKQTIPITKFKQRTTDRGIIVKNIKLDVVNYILKINNDEKFVSFKSKKDGEGIDAETKLYKIFRHLWDYKWTYKKDNLLERGEWVAKNNLLIQGKTTGGGLDALLGRLRKRLSGLPIIIEPNNAGKYRLVIKLQ
ncbi:MAG: hypothetical protein WC349_03835 [Patescibacteria group bacterium]|jgi:hypothetical protein